jgi:cytochrome c biogenesis protein CcdA
MTRKEFLQYAAGAIVVVFGLSNILSLFGQFTKTTLSQDKKIAEDTHHGFGSRKFGV